MKLILLFAVCLLLFIQPSWQLPVKQEDETKIGNDGNSKEKRELFIKQYCELVKAGKGDINLCLDLLKQRDLTIGNIIGNIGKRSIPFPNSDGLEFIDKNGKNVPKINNNEITEKQKRDFWSRLRDKVTDKFIDNIGKRNAPSEEDAVDNSHKDQSIDKIGKNLINAANDEIGKKEKRDFWSESRDEILGGIFG